MKRNRIWLLLILPAIALKAQRRNDFFPEDQLTTVGVYYYPEHWDSTQWDRDLQKIADMGFEYTHYGEFAWAQLEPEEGKYDFKWLDRAVDLAARHNLKVIMCTSTATPPVWLTRKHPDILMKNEDGTRMDHGSRQHASFSNKDYRQVSLKMIESLAAHYGKNEWIMGWQLDNEPKAYYDHGDDAQQRFRDWLKHKYTTLQALNLSWGTAFWSEWYSDFSQINVPRRSQWGMNPHQILDHTRFVASETASFLDEQAQTIRAWISPGQWITSNYIPNFFEGFIGMSHELDFCTYTKYMVYGDALGIGRKGYRLGDWDVIASCNDFFRPLSPCYGVMELQPGQVNWGSINPQPAPGAVRLWLWHAFAGGSKMLCTYRFRAPIYGFEQYHAGIVGWDGVTPTPGGLAYQQFIQDIRRLRKHYHPGDPLPAGYVRSKTAILFNHENIWGMEQNKQTSQWNSMGHIGKYYRTLKAFGAPVDFIRDTSDFARYPVIITPAYQQIDRQWVEKLTAYVQNGGNLIMSCRTGHKDREGHLWEAKFAEPIHSLIGSEIEFYDLLMPHTPDTVLMENKKFDWTSWGEILAPRAGTEVWARYQGDFYAGKPAVVFRRAGKGTVTYVGVDSRSGGLERKVLTKLYALLEIPVQDYPEGVTVEYRDGFGIAVNYSDKDYELPISESAEILVGKRILEPAGVLVWSLQH
jgi:beta-galactosidase